MRIFHDGTLDPSKECADGFRARRRSLCGPSRASLGFSRWVVALDSCAGFWEVRDNANASSRLQVFVSGATLLGRDQDGGKSFVNTGLDA